MKLTLPKRVADLVEHTPPSEWHPGLPLDKFSPAGGQFTQKSAVGRACRQEAGRAGDAYRSIGHAARDRIPLSHPGGRKARQQILRAAQRRSWAPGATPTPLTCARALGSPSTSERKIPQPFRNNRARPRRGVPFMQHAALHGRHARGQAHLSAQNGPKNEPVPAL